MYVYFHVPLCVSVFRAVPVPTTATSSSLIHREVINKCFNKQTQYLNSSNIYMCSAYNLCVAVSYYLPLILVLHVTSVSPLHLSGHSETSGLSDGNEGGGGRHEGRSTKRHQRRSVRSRSRHEKTSKAKLNVLNVIAQFK